jgi:hypothetical protein
MLNLLSSPPLSICGVVKLGKRAKIPCKYEEFFQKSRFFMFARISKISPGNT